MKLRKQKERIIVALDVDNLKDAKSLIKGTAGHVGYFKIGLQFILTLLFESKWKDFHTFFNNEMMGCNVNNLIVPGIMFDIKLHDIPNTMAGAMKKISDWSGVIRFVTIHASAGDEAMLAVVEKCGMVIPVAVTLLTSHSEDDANDMYGSPSKVKVKRMAKDAKLAGITHVVCSPKETPVIKKKRCIDEMVLLNPGIRPEYAKKDDQQRVNTPEAAIKDGARWVIIGRAITEFKKYGFNTALDAINKIAAVIEEKEK